MGRVLLVCSMRPFVFTNVVTTPDSKPAPENWKLGDRKKT